MMMRGKYLQTLEAQTTESSLFDSASEQGTLLAHRHKEQERQGNRDEKKPLLHRERDGAGQPCAGIHYCKELPCVAGYLYVIGEHEDSEGRGQ